MHLGVRLVDSILSLSSKTLHSVHFVSYNCLLTYYFRLWERLNYISC